MADMLCELLIEEMPARVQVGAEVAFLNAITRGLQDNGLAFTIAESLSTPRRLAVIVKGVPPMQADTREERKGPRVDAPAQAIQGFLKSVGGDKDDLEIRDTPKGQVYFAVIEKQGQATAAVLPSIINTAIGAIAWNTSMRFADYSFRFVRPLQRIIAVFDGQAVQGALPLGNDKTLAYTDKTLGHRFMGTGDIRVTADTYQMALEKAHVIADRTIRKQQIIDDLHSQATAKGVRPIMDKRLLDEVVGLVEMPVVLMGDIPEKFMRLPREVLSTSLREHQKFFVFETADGTLAPYFATVANIKASDGGEAIIRGNQKVLHARLSDSVFFYDNDIKNWATYTQNSGLENVVFHARLGSVKDRVQRVESLSCAIAKALQYDPATIDKVEKTARICKSDLVSEMVFEFPELQGIMGKYYAQNAGEDAQVVNAIQDHYKPRGANDAVPTDAVAIAVAIAEKIDTLCGFWAIGEHPTGSKDPYALRRCALGVLRIVLANALPLDIMAIVAKSMLLYSFESAFEKQQLENFLIDRLKYALKSENIRHDYIGAVLGAGLDATVVDKVQLARTMRDNADIVSAVKSAYTRASSIVSKAEKTENFVAGKVDTTVFVNDLESALYNGLQQANKTIAAAKQSNDFKVMMTVLSDLNTPLKAFFDGVMVNDTNPKIRHNRLNILAAVATTVDKIADFNIIEK